MSSNNFRFLGGMALILSGMFTISTFFALTPDGDLTPLGFILDLLSYILLVPGFLVLHDRYKAVAPISSLAAVLLGIAGLVIFGLLGPLVPSWETIAGWIGVLGLGLPIMLFGISFYRNPTLGMPRLLGIISILTGIMAVLNVTAILTGGGDWKNTGNAILASLILVSYSALLILSAIWCIWAGWALLSQKSA